MNTVKTAEEPTSEVDTSWRGMLADPEAVFIVGMLGAIAAYGAFFWKTMPWLADTADKGSEGATLRDVLDYLNVQGGNPLSRIYFSGGGVAVAVVIVLGIVLTWVPLPTARFARGVAITASLAGLAWTFAALAFAPGTRMMQWLSAGVHAQAIWLAVAGYVLLGLAAAMARPAARREL